MIRINVHLVGVIANLRCSSLLLNGKMHATYIILGVDVQHLLCTVVLVAALLLCFLVGRFVDYAVRFKELAHVLGSKVTGFHAGGSLGQSLFSVTLMCLLEGAMGM